MTDSTPALVLRDIARLKEREVGPSRAGGILGTAVAEVPSQLRALVDAVNVFEREATAYALIGGVAVGLRSRVPRATLDVDFAVTTTTDLDGLAGALTRAGFTFRGRHPHSMNFLHGSGEPVQLAFDPEFDAIVLRAEALDLDEGMVRVVTTPDLIQMKRRAASDPNRRKSKALRDQADVLLLEGDVPAEDEGW